LFVGGTIEEKEIHECFEWTFQKKIDVEKRRNGIYVGTIQNIYMEQKEQQNQFTYPQWRPKGNVNHIRKENESNHQDCLIIFINFYEYLNLYELTF